MGGRGFDRRWWICSTVEVDRRDQRTSTTTTVTLSLPPASLAVSTSRRQHSLRDGTSARIRATVSSDTMSVSPSQQSNRRSCSCRRSGLIWARRSPPFRGSASGRGQGANPGAGGDRGRTLGRPGRQSRSGPGQARESYVPPKIGAAVSDVSRPCGRRRSEQDDEGRSHAALVGTLRLTADFFVGAPKGILEYAFRVRRRAPVRRVAERDGEVSTAMRLAISPAVWPPTPSATAKRPSASSTRNASSSLCRTRPMSDNADARRRTLKRRVSEDGRGCRRRQAAGGCRQEAPTDAPAESPRAFRRERSRRSRHTVGRGEESHPRPARRWRKDSRRRPFLLPPRRRFRVPIR